MLKVSLLTGVVTDTCEFFLGKKMVWLGLPMFEAYRLLL